MSADAATSHPPPPRSAEARASLPFRLDIQGMRALAVVLVIANHLAPGTLPGGYVGVDVFFVVSGYLITGLLLGEATRDTRISLAGFYARRARRILPAATVVTVVTVVASVLTLSLLRAQTILTDAVWATFFAANVRMAEVGTDYFAIGQPPSPFRHYWSLSVEEQFYLVWPAVLVLCLALLRRRGDRSAQGFRRMAGAVIVVVSLASLAWSVWATDSSPVTAYFSSLTRAWELGVGAACALLMSRARLQPAVRQVLAVAGLAAIAVATLAFSGTTPFPGAHALVPVLGAAALVVAGEGAAPTAVGRLLSVRPMVVIGDWSYSLYLWHWPVIVLLRSNLGPERFATLPVRVGTLVLVVLLSWATYRFVETPFRRGRWRLTSRALMIYPATIGAVVAVVLVGGQVVSHQLERGSDEPPISTTEFAGHAFDGDPYVALVEASALAARQGRAVPGDLVPGLVDLRAQTASLGDCDYRTGTTGLCPVGDPEAGRSIVVLGDSRARALSPAVEELGREHGYRVYVLVYSGCSATSLVQVDRATGEPWAACEDFKSWALDTIASIRPEMVVVSTSVGRFLDPATGEVLSASAGLAGYLEALRSGWQELFSELDEAAAEVALVGNTPKLPRETGVCLSQGEPDLGDCAFAPGGFAHREAVASFRAARAVRARVVDAGRWFCSGGLCPSVVGRFITMRDSEHMTPDYARWLAPALAGALGLGEPPAGRAAP